MFSDAILVQIFSDDRLNGIPLEYQSTVVHVVEDVIDRRFYTDKPFASRESSLSLFKISRQTIYRLLNQK